MSRVRLALFVLAFWWWSMWMWDEVWYRHSYIDSRVTADRFCRLYLDYPAFSACVTGWHRAKP